MTLGASLSNALTGLTAASRMAEVVSSNLANALTDGYGRREVSLSSANLGGRGAGVRIDGIARITDRGLLSDRRMADSSLARDSNLSAAWVRLERMTGTADASDSLAGQIARLEGALVAAGSDPSSPLRLDDVLRSLTSVTGGFRDRSAEIDRMRTDAEAGIAADVDLLNTSLGQVKSLNDDIQSALVRGEDATALMDARQRAVDRVAGIVPVRSLDRPNGGIALVSTGGAVLLDGKPAEIGFAQRTVVTAEMSYAGGQLSGLTINGKALSPSDGHGKLAGGSLGAGFALRDTILPGEAARLDAQAADLVARFQDTGIDPTLLPGGAGLLTDGGGPLGTVPGLAARIAVNAAVDPARGGATWRLRDGVNATAPGPVGNGAQIQSWQDALAANRILPSGGAARSAAGHAADHISHVSAARLAAEEKQSFTAARHGTLRTAELAMGVDTDAELQTLLLVEQAYAANARVIQTIDGLLQTLLEI